MSEISRAMDRARRERERPSAAGRPDGRRRAPIVADSPSRAPLADTEEYLKLASEIYMALPDKQSRLIMFASSVPGEGTSTVARDFAEAIARGAEVSTVLLDSNLRRPSQHEAFRARRDPGLTDYVLSSEPLENCLVDVATPNLSLLPAGRPTIAPPRVFADGRMGLLIDELRRRFAMIVVDATPLVSFPEGVQFSRAADGVIVVIRSGRTKRELVTKALDHLGETGANVLGTILNRRRLYIPQLIYERL